MRIITLQNWDQLWWKKASSIYFEAFAGKSPKPEKVIRNMFRKEICCLHVLVEGEEVLAMAITGELKGLNAILIDYLAVRSDLRGRGIGRRMMECLKAWAGGFDYFVIEAESDETLESAALMKFWTNSGFLLTDYVHHYIWVPEVYRALYLNLDPSKPFVGNGEELFKYIGEFHKASFSGV